MTSAAVMSQVSEVYARYSFGVDHQRAEVIESCFAPEGAIGVVGNAPMAGRRAISTRLLRVADPTVVHHAFNIVILDASPNEIVARADFTMAKAGSVFATGSYDDCLVELPEDGWVFARRTVTYTWRASSG